MDLFSMRPTSGPARGRSSVIEIFWTRDRRMMVLRDLARIPSKLDLPIVHEYYARTQFDDARNKDGSRPSEYEISVATHSSAFAGCELRIDEYMMACFPTEVAQLVAENNDQSKRMIRDVHQAFRNPHLNPGIIPNNRLPLKHIRGSIHFADKNEFAPLQIADLCAFIIRGRMNKNPRHEPYNSRLYRRLKSMMFRYVDADDGYHGPLITVRPPYVSTSYS